MVNQPGQAVTIYADDGQVLDALNKLLVAGGDGRPAFQSISSDWFKENRTIFRLKSAGQYVDLAPSTKKQKIAMFGEKGEYPILRGKYRRIETGLTQKGSEYNVFEISKTSLVLGVKDVPEAVYNQLGTSKMPQRVFVFNSKHGGEEYALQMTRWKQIYQDTLYRRLTKVKGRG